MVLFRSLYHPVKKYAAKIRKFCVLLSLLIRNYCVSCFITARNFCVLSHTKTCKNRVWLRICHIFSAFIPISYIFSTRYSGNFFRIEYLMTCATAWRGNGVNQQYAKPRHVRGMPGAYIILIIHYLLLLSSFCPDIWFYDWVPTSGPSQTMPFRRA